MLRPQSNDYRQRLDLSGIWDFRLDPEGRGTERGWHGGIPAARPIAVPGSWNDQIAGAKHHFGTAWYQTEFTLPPTLDDARVRIRFGSVNYHSEAWLNGTPIGSHEGGHLPFEFDVTEALHARNVLVVRVEGHLDPNRVPAGEVRRDPLDNFMRPEQLPDTAHDFFPYCGIHRPVELYATSRDALADLTIRTDIGGSTGIVHVTLHADGHAERARIRIRGHGAAVDAETTFDDPTSGDPGSAEATLEIPRARLWSPEEPNLYTLHVELLRGDDVTDAYEQPFGVRTVRVDGDRLLLNGRPVHLRGFGRHEDSPVAGRGLQIAWAVKDHELLRATHANSYRTSHYPYAEEALDLADRLGFLVIAETPCVEMYFHADGLDARLATWETQIRELIARDKNRPSVILWSIANEPHNTRPESSSAFERLLSLTRDLDPTRPATFASYLGIDDPALEHVDLIALNRYRGWYTESGDIGRGIERLDAELDALHRRHAKPIFISEFGADAVPGLHADPPTMFSEEYQLEYLEANIRLFESKPYVIGEHVWNLCDFATAQAVNRVAGRNYKGVFTREREPKMAARRIRELWSRPRGDFDD